MSSAENFAQSAKCLERFINNNIIGIFSPDYKSDSEIYTEPKVGKKSKTDSKGEKYKKINLDEK